MKSEPVLSSEAAPQTSSASSPSATPHRLPRIHQLTWLICLLFVALFYCLIKGVAFNPYAGDEHIYLYQSVLIGDGVVPYSEFAVAHPPGQMLFTAAVFKLFGYHFLLGRALPMAWCLLAGVLLAVWVWRRLGAVASIAAMGLFLFSYEPLRASSHYTGVNMTIALLIAAAFALDRRAIRLGAVLSVAAVYTRLYAIPGVAVLTLWVLVNNRRDGLKLMIWGAAVGTSAFLATGIWCGFGDMIHNMVRYHAQKTAMAPDALTGMRKSILFHNAPLALLFGLSLIAQLGIMARAFNRQPSDTPLLNRIQKMSQTCNLKPIWLSTLVAFGFWIVLLNMDRVWMYYFTPSFPFAAVAGGWLVSVWIVGGARLVQKALTGPKGEGFSRTTGLQPLAFGGAVTLAAIFCFGWYFSPRLEADLPYYKRDIPKPIEARTHSYTWQAGILPEPLADVVKTLFWRESRVIGNPHSSFNYYLWHESRILDISEDIVDAVIRHTSETGAIFGDSGTVPLFALLTGRPIAAHEVDTNIQRYRSGNADPEALIKRIDNANTEMIILRRRFGVAGLSEVRALVRSKYKNVKTLRSRTGKVFYLFTRRS